MVENILDYLHAIENSYAQGIATEHSYRPALKALVEGLGSDINALNEPQHVACGAPDFLISRKTGHGMETLGHIETKDIGKSLSQEERSEQMKRYLAGLRNLILTDYLEFRWYVDGTLRRSARLAEIGPGPKGDKLKKVKDGAAEVEALLKDFLSHQPQQIASAAELAQRMARLAHLIRDVVIQAFQLENASSLLKDWREAFAKVLIADLDQPEKVGEFADMFAQTLAYGLFSARVMDESQGFTLQEAQRLIPKSNPFLRKFFSEITGLDLDDEPFAGYVTDLVQLLDHSDMLSILKYFEKRSGHDDPVVHFYETFLAAYDPRLRELRGVYYTPKPVVSFIVRSIDQLLKTRFNLPDGLADASKITIPNPDKSSKNKKVEVHKVLVLDPATGTATFPYTVIDLIRQEFMTRGDAGMWPGYVREALLPRLYAFEVLMAPYAVAHFKLALQLAAIDLPEAARATWTYTFAGGERLNVFLTNTLEQPHEWTGLPLFTRFLADETQQANRVKQDLPIMVILGNPPYSGQSSNQGKWIRNLVQDYYFLDGKPLGEKNPKWLQDDYVKFIRWAQWRIEQTGSGVLGFITNNGYLDNPTFRGMRQSLMKTFDEIFILDLHGNTKKKDIAPDGSADKNVFDIQQGVSIGIFLRRPNRKADGMAKAASIYHSELWGSRESKYLRLQESDIETVTWEKLEPVSPYYLFVPQNSDFREEYNRGWKINEIFPVNSVGLVTARDALTINWTPEEAWQTVEDFVSLPIETAREKYHLGEDAQDWKVKLAQEDLTKSGPTRDNIVPILYRPFDIRYTYYTGRSRGFICRPRSEVMNHMIASDNLGLVLPKRVETAGAWQHLFCSRHIVDHVAVSLKTIDALYPLYKHANVTDQPSVFGDVNLSNNLNAGFVKGLQTSLNLTMENFGKGNLQESVGPEDIFDYIYAILHSPTYRMRYAEFLKMDFPRIPLTSNRELFRRLCELGEELVSLHLLEAPQLSKLITRYPISGENRVEKGYPRYTEDTQRVYINPQQYFEGVPSKVWEFPIGGYQVLDKWLKDRRGRLLTYEDLSHYQKVVVALNETMRLMNEINQAIEAHGGWPIQ